jgi:5,10-methylenetetrahydromethanopterin reductase
MELAGQIGDGVLLNYMVTPAYTARAMEALAAGAKRAGRSVDQIDRPQLIVCSMDHDRKAALDRARELLTQYLGQQPHIMAASGVDPALIEAIGAELTWPAGPEQIARAMRLVPDEAVQAITASGTPAECRAKVAQYLANGATCPVLYPLGDDVRLMIDAFGPREPAQQPERPRPERPD